MASTKGPMFIPIPPGLSRHSSMSESLAFYPPPGLPSPPSPPIAFPGEMLRAFAHAQPAIIELAGRCTGAQVLEEKSSCTSQPDSLGTRCSTDEPGTPPAPPTPLSEAADPEVARGALKPWTLEDGGVEAVMEQADEAELEAALEPVLKEILSQDKQKTKEKPANGNVRWWTRPSAPLLCPLSGFPTCLLPYPPFKLRVDPTRSAPHRLVDGKYLAMTCIVTGRFVACGRELQTSDISALDDYIHRCKLGPYRPGRAVVLMQQAASSPTAEQRDSATQELERFVASARAELGKVRRIQENRLTQIQQALPTHLQSAIRFPTQEASSALPEAKGRRPPAFSTGSVSTRASFSSDCSLADAPEG
ncbi:RHBDL3 [Symbiodinium sp. CCMP2456]|nr:RHBDL3 [Symbiodinium sp. CCMP2456]